MSIKDLFDKGHSLKFFKNKSQQDLREDLESQRYIDAQIKQNNRFLPDIDYATASNFARFGLAEEYYETSIKRIYQTYPYDGSRAEKTEWENRSTYLDLYIFENEYPRTTGYINLNTSGDTYTGSPVATTYSSSLPQYISFTGGPHPDPSGDYKSDFAPGPEKKGISKANIYHTASQRTNNLEFDLDKGATVEFWMKKNHDLSATPVAREYLFDIAALDQENNTVGGFRAYMLNSNATKIIATAMSGTSMSNESIADLKTQTPAAIGSNLFNGEWNHFAITVKNSNTNVVWNLYINGTHRDRFIDTSNPVSTVTGTMVGTIGAMAAKDEYGAKGAGWGNIISASFDEFRYWKTERNAQQIGRYYRDQVAGGTNTDNIKYDDITNKVDLGVYYKFNEGITGESTTDATVLDYSGRISNGTFVNYSSGCRSTDSAIVLAGAATREFKDPILYSDHAAVSNLLSSKKISGSMHDRQNFNSIYNSLPAWILEEDESKSQHLKALTQIMASYFDHLYLQIQKMSRLKDINYPYDVDHEKPLPFADKLLSSRGYDVPELFADAHALAKFMQRDEKTLFEKKLHEVKNTIYQNIYNNLSYINKSKGTIKSLRNFLRCYGVDEELIRLNIYSINGEYEFEDNFTNTAYKKKYLDFDDPETRESGGDLKANSYTATAYQYVDASDANSLSYISGSSLLNASGSSLTIEAEVFFPKRTIKGDDNYQLFPHSEASIFGMHAADRAIVEASGTDLTFSTEDDIGFAITAVKSHDDKRSVKFGLKVTDSSVMTEKTTDLYTGVYDNEKWNLAFRVYPTNYPLANMVQQSLSGSTPYTYELYGVNYVGAVKQNEFTLRGTLDLASGLKFFTKHKRIFAGAERTNFTGSVLKYSDVKVSSVRYWMDYLSNETIRGHARDASNFGTLQPYKNHSLQSKEKAFQPQLKTLALNWTMDNVTGSDSSGQFLISDFSSGSLSERTAPRYPGLSEISEYSYPGRGDFFVADNNQVIDIEFLQTARQKLPEIVNSDDMVQVMNKYDDVVFTKDTTYISHFLSVEKSMYQTISEEMLRLFSTVVGFNNLIGEPVNRYRSRYKKMEKLRDVFFENVENEPDLDKFIEFYKWVDDAITDMIQQLIPVSSNSSQTLRNMVESHLLERNKYWMKFPSLESKEPKLISTLKGIEELEYNWKFGHAPIATDGSVAEQNTNQDKNCLWWKQRAERDVVLSSGDDNVDSDKKVILKTTVTEVTGTEPTLKTIGGAKYTKTYYPARSLARAASFKSERTLLDFRGGSNPQRSNKHDFYKGVIKWASDDDFIYLDMSNDLDLTSKAVCNDQVKPPELDKKRVNLLALTMPAHELSDSKADGSGANDQLPTDGKAGLLLPFSVYTSSVDTGYQKLFSNQLSINFTNMHDDKYGFDAEVPMQGPFAEKYIGGMQHRHIKLNQGTDTPLTRAEGWHLQEFLNPTAAEHAAVQTHILHESFYNASTTPTTDTSILSLPSGSISGEPSTYEYWGNGNGADNLWTILDGPTPSAGTGPSDSPSNASGYAYCNVTPLNVGQTFGFVSPIIDLLDYESVALVRLQFRYHMHGLHCGSLKVQASGDPTFQTDVEDLLVSWNAGSASKFFSTVISGQQQLSKTEDWDYAVVSSNNSSLGGYALDKYLGRRFYIRFFYTAGITHMGDIAISDIQIIRATETGPGIRNSFKLLSPTHDNHHRPSAVLTRQEYAKRPVNIRNILMTGSSPTVAGNYLNRYEVVNTVSPEANDPWFVKNADKITQTTAQILPGKYLFNSETEDSIKVSLVGVGSSAWGAFTQGAKGGAPGVGVSIRIKTSTASVLDGCHIRVHTQNIAFGKWYMFDDDNALGSTGAIWGAYTVVQIQGKTTAEEIAEELKLAIESTNGHDGKIIVERHGALVSLRHNRVKKATFELPNRDYLTGSIKNKMRFKSRFSSPGGFEVMSRGFLDPAHEIYSVYNAMPWRNNWSRTVYNSQLQAHCGKFGASTHGSSNSFSRVYGLEVTGNISSVDYVLRDLHYSGVDPGYHGGRGDAAKHKHHRNNIERIEYIGDDPLSKTTTFPTASSYDNAFVSHMIPRTDKQYAWITGSII